MTKRATSVEQGALPPTEEEEEGTGGGATDELIRRAAADRAARRDTGSDVDALVKAAADQNRAAIDRLAQ